MHGNWNWGNFRFRTHNGDACNFTNLGKEENSFSFPNAFSFAKLPVLSINGNGNSVCENYILRYDIIATITWNGRKKKGKKKNWKLAAINTRPSDKGKSKVGQELYIEADNRQVGIIGDDKSIPAYYRNAIIEMCALVIACTDPCSMFEQLSLILSDKSWRSFKVEMIPAIVTKG